MKSAKLLQQWIIVSLKKYGWLPVILFTFHLAVSRIFQLYDLYPSIDIPMHFIGGFCIAYFLKGSYLTAKRLKLLGQPTNVLGIITVFALVGLSTILWEFSEFSYDFIFHTALQTGLADTMLDMFLGMLGGIVLLAMSSLQGGKLEL